jgi:hypothetical protein
MSICPTCGNRSEQLYRCDEPSCGADLTDVSVEEFRYPTDVGRRDDGLVEVRFPMTCLECDDRRLVPLSYADVGTVVRFGCLSCETVTKHRPTDEAVRYQVHRMGLDDVGLEEQPADQNPTVSSPA